MRVWACKTLLDREAAVRGGTSAVTPYSCDPDFGKLSNMSQADAMIAAFANSTGLEAKNRGATADQVEQLKTCFATDFKAALTPAQIEGMNATLTTELTLAINQVSGSVAQACSAKVGIK